MFSFETELQATIRQTIRSLAKNELPRFQSDEYHQSVPRDLFTLFARNGLCGLTVAEQFGGTAQGALSSMLVMEELASVDLGPAIFLSVHLMVTAAIQRHGNESQKRKYLPRLASGELLGAFALTEPGAGSDAAALVTSATNDGSNFILNGEKCYITSAGFADLYLVFARSGSSKEKPEISAFLVEKLDSGLACGAPEKKMGCELSPIASLRFNDLRLNEDRLLGALHQGYKIALSSLAGGRINIASCANGISSAALSAALKFTSERKQFKSRVVDFQGIEFMLADMHMGLEAAKLLTWQAAAAHEGIIKGSDIELAASTAKCFATDTAMRISTDAVQLHGGAGYIKEYRVERMMREAKMLQIVEGTNQIQRIVIARGIKKHAQL